jgi:phage-related minor tail protein
LAKVAAAKASKRECDVLRSSKIHSVILLSIQQPTIRENNRKRTNEIQKEVGEYTHVNSSIASTTLEVKKATCAHIVYHD